jgi:hypothetical protein
MAKAKLTKAEKEARRLVQQHKRQHASAVTKAAKADKLAADAAAAKTKADDVAAKAKAEVEATAALVAADEPPVETPSPAGT